MGLFFGRKKANKFEQERLEWQAKVKAAEEAKAEAERLERERIEREEDEKKYLDPDNYPHSTFTAEQLDDWLERHAGLPADCDIQAVVQFKHAILNPQKSFLDMGNPLLAASEAIENGELSEDAVHWMIRGFVAAYDGQYNGEYSPEDAELAALYAETAKFVSDYRETPERAYFFLGSSSANYTIFDGIERYLGCIYYGKGTPAFKNVPCYSGLKSMFREDFNRASADSVRHNLNLDLWEGAGTEYKRPCFRWKKDMGQFFTGDFHYPAAQVFVDIAMIFAAAYVWKSKEDFITRTESADHSKSDSAVYPLLQQWVLRNPEWHIISKDCVGAHGEKTLQLCPYGKRAPHEFGFLLASKYGVIHIDSIYQEGRIVLWSPKASFWECLPLVDSNHSDGYHRPKMPNPTKRMASGEFSLKELLGDVPLHSFICFSAPDVVFLTPPKDRAYLCPYDVIACESLDIYLSQIANYMSAKCEKAIDVKSLIHKIESAKVKTPAFMESAPFMRIDSTNRLDAMYYWWR